MSHFSVRDFQRRLRTILVFIELHILMYRLLQHQPQQVPPQPPPTARQPPRRRHNMWVRPWIMQREETGAYHNLLKDLSNTDIPGFINLMRMTPEFFEMIKARVEPCLAKQATNYRAPLSVGMKLAITLKHLATGESYTSLSYQFMVERSSISTLISELCRVIQS